MDNNNSTKETLPTQPAPVSQPQTATNNSDNGEGGDSKKMIMMLVIGLVVIIIVVGAIYYFLSKKQTNLPASQTTEITTTKQPSLAQIKDALDQDLDSINVQAVEDDFKNVDSDLQKL